MIHASLCTGIGACELAASWLGWENAFSCEINPFCQRVLKYYYPKSKHYGNIYETHFTEWRGKIDVLTAGFPCQPFSCAGTRKGAEDDRYLWPEVLRVIEEVRPTWFIGENVAGITSMVLPGDEIEVGSYRDICDESYTETEVRQQFVIDRICNDIESIGYSVQPIIIPACAVGAPHRRDRIWFIANTDSLRCHLWTNYCDGHEKKTEKRTNIFIETDGFSSKQLTPNSLCERLQGITINGKYREAREKPQNKQSRGLFCPTWQKFPTQSPVCSRNDGIPCRLSGITVPKHRIESMKSLGNTMVPQVVYQIFKCIEEIEKQSNI